jgi:hypothetical protein
VFRDAATFVRKGDFRARQSGQSWGTWGMRNTAEIKNFIKITWVIQKKCVLLQRFKKKRF